MGRFCEPVYRLVYALPFGDYLRAPVKWHHLTEFCLCVLAGHGLAFLHARLSSFFAARGVLPSRDARRETRGSSSASAHSIIRLFDYSTILLSILILVGVVCLVSDARLYCAPHRADADMQFADARITQDPRGIAQLNQMRARVIGQYGGMALIEIPRAQKDDKKPELPKPQPVTLSLGILSLLGTLAVAAYGVRKS